MTVREDKKEAVFGLITELIGSLGTCDRAQVGALIVKDGRCISWGYNGAPPGLPHCNENMHGYAHPENEYTSREILILEDRVSEEGCRNATHAEANALAFAARQGISCEGATLYVGIQPCATCARLLVAAGISKVVALNEYRDTTGVDLLREAGVEV